MKPVLLAMLLFVGVHTTSAAAPATGPANYEQTLYDLGAFPVAKLTKPYWTNGNPGRVYSKGRRVDVDGWVPPYETPSYLTDAEKTTYGIPRKALRYEQYMALLDVDTYKRTRDPKLFLVMRFTLENMFWGNMRLKREDLLRVYEARIGLEEWAVPLGKGQLPSDDGMRLLRTYGDEKLFDILPAPKAADKTYVTFLEEQANASKWSLRARLSAHRLLYALDKKACRKPYEDFLLANAKSAKEWWERSLMYEDLITLHDENAWQAVREGLMRDPVTEVRESILYHLKEQGEVAAAIDAILVIVNCKDEKHAGVSPGRAVVARSRMLGERMMGEWSCALSEYLKWAKSLQTLDPATATKVQDAAEKLAKLEQMD